MNVARCYMRPKRITPGLKGDENMEESLLRMQMTNNQYHDNGFYNRLLWIG